MSCMSTHRDMSTDSLPPQTWLLQDKCAYEYSYFCFMYIGHDESLQDEHLVPGTPHVPRGTSAK